MKQIRERPMVRRVKAWVVMEGSRHIATVQGVYSEQGGEFTINVFQTDRGMEASALAHNAVSAAFQHKHPVDFAFQSSTIRGYNVDKEKAVFSGIWIGKRKLCGEAEVSIDPPEDGSCPKGYALANWSGPDGKHRRCYQLPGLDFLSALGYTVIEVF